MDFGVGYYLLIFFVAFFASAVATPIASKIAIKIDIIDKPGLHKTHINPKPLLGGLAIFIGFAATVFFFLEVDDKLISLVVATSLLVLTGLLDDIYNLKPLVKLSGQTAAAVIIVLWNVDSYHVPLDYFAYFKIPGSVVLIFIIGWIVLMVNAFNLIDGLDGLAAGTATIILVAMITISMIVGVSPNMLGIQIIALGACLGFLIFNFSPAQIFMGDTGSMLLGFILANIHLFTIKYPFDASLVLGSLFIFAYPALDIFFAVYRRLCHKCPIFQADRGHIHHILRSLGYSVRKSVMILYGVNSFFALFAVVLLTLNMQPRMLIVIGIITLIAIIIAFKKLLQVAELNGVGS